MIYVVDDDYDVLKSLRFLLETEGFDVRTFRSGSALLGSSTRHGADCLVVDYKMAGIDGLELAHRLRGLDVSVCATHEPGGTPLGDQLRQLALVRSDLRVVPVAEALLMCTSRAQLVEQVIRPALAGGEVVICDRFAECSEQCGSNKNRPVRRNGDRTGPHTDGRGSGRS